MLFVDIPRTLFPIVVIPVVNTSPSVLSVTPDPTLILPYEVAVNHQTHLHHQVQYDHQHLNYHPQLRLY